MVVVVVAAQLVHSKKLENQPVAATEVDKGLMSAQIEAVLATMGKDDCDRFGISADTCAKNMNSNNVDVVRRQMDRLLMACNQHMLSRHALPAAPHVEVAINDGELTKKRKAEDTTPVVEPDAPDAGDLLRQALESTLI